MVVENFKSFFVIAIFFKTFSLKISLFYFFEFEKSFFTGKDLTRIEFLNISKQKKKRGANYTIADSQLESSKVMT